MPGHSCNLVPTSQYSWLILRVRDQAPRFKRSAAGTSYGEGGGGGGGGGGRRHEYLCELSQSYVHQCRRLRKAPSMRSVMQCTGVREE